MPEIPDVGAIAQQVRARIKHIEDQLRQHQRLNDELERLRDALSRLEGGARSRVGAPRRDRKPAPKPAGSATRTAAAKPASTPARAQRTRASKPASTTARAPRGQNKAKVLDALKDGPMTASEISKATGIATGTVSTLLTKLAKSDELAKAERGYKLPE
jgi:CRP-like cAMP-binding protein